MPVEGEDLNSDVESLDQVRIPLRSRGSITSPPRNKRELCLLADTKNVSIGNNNFQSV